MSSDLLSFRKNERIISYYTYLCFFAKLLAFCSSLAATATTLTSLFNLAGNIKAEGAMRAKNIFINYKTKNEGNY